VTSGPPSADWYPDPGGSGRERYWDGERWTKQLRPGPQSAAMPQQQAWPPASTDCPQGAQVNGGNQSWQYRRPMPPSPPPPRGVSKTVILWAVAALILVFTGLGVALGYHHFHPGLGGVNTSSTTTSESAPAPYEQAYLDELHAISARVPAVSWGRSNSELLSEGHVACADLDASPRRNPYQASQDVQAWGGWPFNPDPVVISPAPGQEDLQPPITLPGKTASSQAGELVQMAEFHLCHQTVERYGP
jgi:hypothetical protein